MSEQGEPRAFYEPQVLYLAHALAKRKWGEHYEGCEESDRELAEFCIAILEDFEALAEMEE